MKITNSLKRTGIIINADNIRELGQIIFDEYQENPENKNNVFFT